jgi:hypothetical protein
VTDGIQSLSILAEKFSSHHNPTLILFTRSSNVQSMDSVEFVLRRMCDELRVMEANSEQCAVCFDIDFDDRPVFDSYSDDLDDGPVFDAYPTDLDDGQVYDTDADNLDHGSNIAAPVTTIDTSSTCSMKCPHAAVHTKLARYVATTEFEFTKPEHDVEHAVFDFEGDPLFDEEPIQTAADYSIEKEFTFGSNITATPTSEDRPSTCSMKCPHTVLHTELTLVIRLCEVVLLPHCKALDTYCSGAGGHGWR